MCAFVLSGAAPSVAASKASAAVVAASSASRGAISRAHDDAAVATRLDPLSDAGPLADSTIALRLGNVTQAETYTLQAIRRDPNDVAAWQRLLYIEFARRNKLGAYQSLLGLLKLDPQSATSKALVRSGYLFFRR